MFSIPATLAVTNLRTVKIATDGGTLRCIAEGEDMTKYQNHNALGGQSFSKTWKNGNESFLAKVEVYPNAITSQ